MGHCQFKQHKKYKIEKRIGKTKPNRVRNGAYRPLSRRPARKKLAQVYRQTGAYIDQEEPDG